MKTEALLTEDAQAPFQVERRGPADNRLIYSDSAYFAAELDQLGRIAWQFAGTVQEVREPGDWLRLSIFGHDVFVQNVSGELRAFSNVCQHRGYPIRVEPQGNGPIMCGLHAWRYDGHGRLIGVARNEELYGMSREQRGERGLRRLRLETVGPLIFVAATDDVPPIENYLGRYRPLLKAIMARAGRIRHRWMGSVRANWKLFYEITLDDYHVAFVHPESLGNDVREAKFMTYERSDAHSRMFARRTDDWTFPGFWDAVERGEYEFAGYKIHHIFPTLFLVAGREMILLTRLTPISPTETRLDDWAFDVAGNLQDDDWWDEFVTLQRRVSGEDRAACEAHQATIAGFERRAVYGRLEQRLAWFHDSYEERVGAAARRRIGR